MTHKKIFLKVLFLVFISIALSMNAYSYIWLNGAGGGYEEGDGSESTYGENVTVEDYIIEGAGYYLAANAGVQSLLNMAELKDSTGIDYYLVLKTLDRAISNMENAINTYEKLIGKAESTPYNKAVIDKLANFNYSLFTQEKGLNGVVFGKVEEYLKNGDITGMFKYTYSGLQTIFSALNRVKEDISLDKFPGTPVFWNLSDAFSETSLFGGYVARVFSEIY